MNDSLYKKKKNRLVLSLGSNKGDRLQYILQAYDLIEIRIGEITAKSQVYEMTSWGFDGSLFLNSCITLDTPLGTKASLDQLQQIEREIGRKTKTTTSYENRCIDLDILYASEGIFKYPHLCVPHPELPNRKFVLQPLSEIIPQYRHPLLHKSSIQLLEECSDTCEIRVFTIVK